MWAMPGAPVLSSQQAQALMPTQPCSPGQEAFPYTGPPISLLPGAHLQGHGAATVAAFSARGASKGDAAAAAAEK
eukprot:4158328-Pyramimonas_sp.AAC.1